MLYAINHDGSMSRIDEVPHKKDFDMWRSRLTPAQYAAIEEEIERRVHGHEVRTAGWLPGNDWTGTVFQPIHDIACQGNKRTSGLFFGLIVWNYFMEHPDDWSFGRYAMNGIPIESLTYFRIRQGS